MTHTKIPTETHQGFSLASTTDAPTGLVLLIEPQAAHDRFRADHPHRLTVLLRITDVTTLVDQDATADSYFGERTTVITTTTVNDRYLTDLDWVDERDLVQQFQPDFHVPCDYPVYKEDNPELREKHVLNCLEGTIWMAGQLHGTTTRVIPLLKGETPEERRLCYQVFNHLGTRYCVFYGTQYFTGGLGFARLREDLLTVVAEAPHLHIMLVGLQAADRLEQLPPQVVAAAGQRWIREIQLRDVSAEEAQDRAVQMEKNVAAALDDGPMPLMAWADGPEVTA